MDEAASRGAHVRDHASRFNSLRRLGVRLVQPTAWQVKPALDGDAYYRRCLAILDEIDEAETIVSIAKPRGLLRIDVQGTGLVECLAKTPPSPTPGYAMYPRSRQLNFRVRVFIEGIAKRYTGDGAQST
jgi:DNA-binding transcriptional LysR family regulator